MKPLVVFDIDGTITATIEVDDYCFVKTFGDLYKIDLAQADWSEFQHATDLGLSRQIFNEHFKRLPKIREIESIKHHFLGLLKKQYQLDPSKFSEVAGAVSFFNSLRELGFPVAIATGGWRETAVFKLEKVGLDVKDIPFAHSNNHYSRSKITQLAIDSAMEFYSSNFRRTLYFGDGKWDLLTCREMGIDFIGVDFYGTGSLRKLAAENVVKDFTDRKHLLKLL